MLKGFEKRPRAGDDADVFSAFEVGPRDGLVLDDIVNVTSIDVSIPVPTTSPSPIRA